jgi:hypothetical protein
MWLVEVFILFLVRTAGVRTVVAKALIFQRTTERCDGSFVGGFVAEGKQASKAFTGHNIMKSHPIDICEQIDAHDD